ncbi:MAG: hypothetical protein LBJ47_01715 [Tannerella sp.]|jgi:hypothetical protein|nr:hypothetical protein [Tannerella sp.]
MKIKNMILLITVLLACASCGQDMADQTEDSTKTITVTDTNNPGILSYFTDYGMWGISVSVSGTIDNVNLYLIKDFKEDISLETVVRVTFSGNYYPSDKKSPIGGMEIFYIDITTLRYEYDK